MILLLAGVQGPAADTVEVGLASTRSQFSFAESIEIGLLYTNNGGNLKELPLEIRHEDGSGLTFRVPFGPGDKAQTRLVTIRAGSLKPGRYTAVSRLGKQEKSVAFAVHSDQHPNPYFIGQWTHHGESRGTTQAKGGWMYMTSDLATLHPRKPKTGDIAEWYVEARMKPFARMVLGGGHQLDLELVNDWGDPWVQRTVAWRMGLAALSNRLYPIGGLHCYDEPGLTWWPTKAVGDHKADTNPFSIPHQLDEFTRITGKKLPEGPFSFTGTQYAGRMDDWLHFMDMRMKYLEQAWYATVWGTDTVDPRQTVLNQVSSSYAPGDTTDGVDSRQARPYKVVCGHGGYSDLPFGPMQPVRSAKAYMGFTRDRPHYFLPMWYTHTWTTMRSAVWMPMTAKLDGMLYTPEQDFGMNMEKHGYLGTHTIFEVAEINRRLALAGDVIRHAPRSPAPVAVLHSHRQFAHDVATLNSPTLHKIGPPQYVSPHRNAVDSCFFRIMEQGLVPDWIDEAEAVDKGPSFLHQWKVIFCPRLATGDVAFRKTLLEAYAATGGKLIQFKGDKLLLKGSIVADHDFGDPTKYYMEKVEKAGGVASPAYRDQAWRKWNNDLAPNFAKDLATWLGRQEYESSNKEVLLGVHKGGGAAYLFFANNAQSRENPRGLRHELIPAETAVSLPAEGVVYDLFRGGVVPVKDGKATLRLAAGDGAFWLHLPEPPKDWHVSARTGKAEGHLLVDIEASCPKCSFVPLPFRLRLIDPAGNVIDELYRATTERGLPEGTARYRGWLPLGLNASPGTWTVEVEDRLTGAIARTKVEVKPPALLQPATVATGNVSIYFDDDRKIADLLAGKSWEPPYAKLNWDAKRVFGLDPKKFAVFGPAAGAEKIAAALRAKGMKVEVNPKYQIKPFVREPGRGGAGVSHGVASNLEDVYAHTIVLPGHPLLTQSENRGHINRPVTSVFPGPGRAYLQWGMGCYQAGWQNIFVLGDADAGITWLINAIEGRAVLPPGKGLAATVKTVPARKVTYPRELRVVRVDSQTAFHDTPVGVGSSPKGDITFVLLHDGSVSAYDIAGKVWQTQALLEGAALAVSPKGDRLAVAGYPGLLVLNAADGKILAFSRVGPSAKGEFWGGNKVTCAAWNASGTLVAGGWLNPDPKAARDPIILNPEANKAFTIAGVSGPVMGAAFVPEGNTLLLGADQLTAVNADSREVIWRNPIKGAQAFAFSKDGKTAAAGGWGKTAGRFSVPDGKGAPSATFDAVVGGVALLPDGALTVAVWGGTHPLFVIRAKGKPEPLFQSQFGFQDVAWWPKHGLLIATEQGGRLWLLDATGRPQALLDERAGTTAYRMVVQDGGVLLARMNRVVQRVVSNK
jgi:hypothetical protein